MDTLPSGIPVTDIYTDFNGLNRLKSAAAKKQPSVNKAVAQQFEALFLQLMLKRMRATVGKGPLDSSQTKMAQSLYDQQLALQLSKQGAIGIGDLLLRQIGNPEQDPSQPSGNTATGYPVPARELFGVPLIRHTAVKQPAQPLQTANRQKPVHGTTHGRGFRHAAHPAPPIPAPRASTPPPAQSQRPGLVEQYEAVQAYPQAAPLPRPARAASTMTSFLERLRPAAEKAAALLGVAPKAILAIAALETGWGKHVMPAANGEPSNNLFGIKAKRGWHKAATIASTLEFEHGAMRRKREPFRSYASPEASVMDFAHFIRSNPRYRHALEQAGNAERFVEELQKAGYATDPNYARKVKGVMKTIERATQSSWRVADNR